MVIRNRFNFALIVLAMTALACQIGGGTSDPPPGGDTGSDILFQDNFSDPSSGWDSYRDADGLTDYEDGKYRIRVNKGNFDYWANPGLTFTDVQVEVTATKSAGPDENDFGIICRYKDVGNFYFFVVGSDGFYGIGKVLEGEQQLVGMDEMGFSNAIRTGADSNNLRADCVGESLTLYVNDQILADVTDDDFSSGDVGLMAGTFSEPGTDVLFDDFVVRRP